jgi:hypothetical protein
VPGITTTGGGAGATKAGKGALIPMLTLTCASDCEAGPRKTKRAPTSISPKLHTFIKTSLSIIQTVGANYHTFFAFHSQILTLKEPSASDPALAFEFDQVFPERSNCCAMVNEEAAI